MDRMDIWKYSERLSKELAITENSRRDIELLPWITLPPGYSFKVIFPFSAAYARFLVRKDTAPEKSISIYLDTKCLLGGHSSPYWEAYCINGDTERFDLGDSEGLVKSIVEELDANERGEV